MAGGRGRKPQGPKRVNRFDEKEKEYLEAS